MSVFKVLLNEQRQSKVKEIISQLDQRESIIDFGCGSGMMLGLLVNFELVKHIIAIDQHEFWLEELVDLLNVTDRDIQYPRKVPLSIEVYKGNLLEFDARLVNKDILMSIEVVEHLQIKDVPLYTSLIFKIYRPLTVVISTPNFDFNTMMEWDRLRNPDHKFEWTKAEFIKWCSDICNTHGYRYEWIGCGLKNDIYATQFAVFTKVVEKQLELEMTLTLKLYKHIQYPHE